MRPSAHAVAQRSTAALTVRSVCTENRGAQGGIWRSAQPGAGKKAARSTRKLASRGGKRKPADEAALAKARAAAEAQDPGGFIPAQTFGGAQAGFSFQTGPLGTGYYRDDAAAAPSQHASPPKPPVERSSSRGETSPAMRSRTVRASPPKEVPVPQLADAPADTERIGEQHFSLMGTFADNYDSDLLRDEPPAQQTATGNSTGTGEPETLDSDGNGQFDEEASRASFLQALGDWRGNGRSGCSGDVRESGGHSEAQVWRNDAPDAVPTQQSEPPPVARCATPIECQTEASRPLARPSTAGAKRPGSASRKSYFEDLLAAKAALSSPQTAAEQRRAELQRLRAAKARQAEELAEMRKRNAELKATLEKENETEVLEKQADEASRFVRECHSPRPDAVVATPESVSPPVVQPAVPDDVDEQQLPVAVPSPAMIALGLDKPAGSRPATPAERDAAKVVAREFTDLLFRPSSAPASRSPGLGGR